MLFGCVFRGTDTAKLCCVMWLTDRTAPAPQPHRTSALRGDAIAALSHRRRKGSDPKYSAQAAGHQSGALLLAA